MNKVQGLVKVINYVSDFDGCTGGVIGYENNHWWYACACGCGGAEKDKSGSFFAYAFDEVNVPYTLNARYIGRRTLNDDEYTEIEPAEIEVTLTVNGKTTKYDDFAFLDNVVGRGDNIVTVCFEDRDLINVEVTNYTPSSGGSKKYKVTDDKDTAEKISGSGKKGSTRTITPIEGRKVASVIVTDKNGNKIDVTLNEDGTYSFKQPASNVNVEVTYKNREITLNIGSTEASVDGEQSNLDVCPVVRNDRTMLPIRFVAENLGAKVEWNEKNPNYVAITRGDVKIEITLGSNIMLVNGEEVLLDQVAFAENDRTYLPVRAVSEALNAIVEWKESESSVVKIYERQ